MALFGVTVSHLKHPSPTPVEINDRQCVGWVLGGSQIVMAEGNYLAPLIGEPIILKLILSMALKADPGTSRSKIQEQLRCTAFLTLDTVKA